MLLVLMKVILPRMMMTMMMRMKPEALQKLERLCQRCLVGEFMLGYLSKGFHA